MSSPVVTQNTYTSVPAGIVVISLQLVEAQVRTFKSAVTAKQVTYKAGVVIRRNAMTTGKRPAGSDDLTVVVAMLWTSSPGSAGYRTLSRTTELQK
jgi:hypothetical protein